MINTSAVVNQPVKLYFYTSPDLLTVSYADIRVVNDGVFVPGASVAAAPVSGVPNLHTITFTPTATGRYMLAFRNDPIAYVEVVTKGLYTYLSNIEDEAVGSWKWDKQLGTLKMIRLDGTELANFAVKDTMVEASRERLD